MVGGSPCQSFSIAGYRKGLDDLRGMLIFEFIRSIKEVNPKVFIFENVKGLININGGKIWNEIVLPSFEKLGYHLH
jgi:DNA (cytosine-5)-methyltransferase 1